MSNPNWRGGVNVHQRGYVQIRVPGRSVQYTMEHVLVMEELIGRRLVVGETVHHKNGVRDDNRPSNLELWCKPQPPGTRAIDTLEWAEEIVRRYAPLRDAGKI